ncbi:cytochrome P450 [Ramlibacter sp.]|uniref:cytochrome P450 n=1 Tax=Ramlibacter sp. TaxID=1917967 RepID=UPI003D0CDB2E
MIDLKDPAFLAGDRSAGYADLRARAPVYRVPDTDTWLLSRHADVQLVLRKAEGRVQPPGTDAPPWMQPGPGLERMKANLAQTDDPIHARLRSVVGPFFVPRNLEKLREVSAASVRRAVDALPDGDASIDVVTQVAGLVPRGAICHLLGIPDADWERLVAVQHDFLLIFSPFPLSDDERERLDKVAAFYRDYFSGLLDNPDTVRNSLLAPHLLEAERAGTLSRAEVVSLMHTVLDAGYETTRTSISNAVELLAQKPELHAQLRDDPSLMVGAIEEILRVRTPIHLRHRFLAESFTASDGTVIPEGAEVLLMLASANRDAAMFPEPDRIDFRRGNAGRHLAFGGGLHHCLGAPLARIQLQETLRALTATFRRFELSAGPGKRYPSVKFPSLMSLPVTGQR